MVGVLGRHTRLTRVNLPRWGLKPVTGVLSFDYFFCVNLPRWGLKHKVGLPDGRCIECKFTPLGFETNLAARG